MKIFLVRHASPDWTRTDIPYDIPPGPPLSPKGEKEAAALAEYLKSEGVVKLYYSPFERSASTAKIVSAANGIPCSEERGLWELQRGAGQALITLTRGLRRASEPSPIHTYKGYPQIKLTFAMCNAPIRAKPAIASNV